MSIQLKDCQVVLTDLSIMKPKSAALLKSKLQKWKGVYIHVYIKSFFTKYFVYSLTIILFGTIY